jgi:hypothetical protein
MGIGVVSYGVSLMFFVLALRGLGAARTAACFAIAPFVGVFIAIIVFGEHANTRLWPAVALVAAGVALHLFERHEHRHLHERLVHTHVHRHDDLHHGHAHPPSLDAEEPHAHEHAHEPLVHSHTHRPDLHHRH